MLVFLKHFHVYWCFGQVTILVKYGACVWAEDTLINKATVLMGGLGILTAVFIDL